MKVLKLALCAGIGSTFGVLLLVVHRQGVRLASLLAAVAAAVEAKTDAIRTRDAALQDLVRAHVRIGYAEQDRDLARGDAARQLGTLVIAQSDLAIAASAEGILRAALERALRGEAGWQEEATAALGPRSEASDRLMEALGSALGDAQAAHAACAGLRSAIAEARSAGAVAVAERDAVNAVGAKTLLHLAAVMAEPGSLATRVFREAAATAVRVSDAVSLIATDPVDGRLPAEIWSLFPELDTGRVRRRIASDADEVAARLEAR